MTAQEICKYIDNILSSGESISKEEIEKIISWLYKIIQNQNNTMADLKNSCIRLQNNISMVEDKISQYSVYKEL